MTSRIPFTLAFAASLAGAACTERSDTPPPLPPASSQAQAPVPDMSALGHELGSVMAAVTVVEFSDFGCPHCARFAHETFPTLRDEFVETGQVRWIFIPVQMGFPNGEGAARTAQCAGDQREFWPMHDLLYERQSLWQSANPAAADPIFLDFARSVGLDETLFLECYRADHPREITDLRRAVAAQVGVRGTPSFIVGDQFVEGTLATERFRELLQQVIAQGRG